MSKRVAEDEKRVALNCLISPVTKATIEVARGESGESQGEIVDRAVAILAAGGYSFKEPRRQSRKAEIVAARAASDLTGVHRDDIDYSDTESAPMTHVLDAVGPLASSGRGKVSMADWRVGRKPLLKPGDKK